MINNENKKYFVYGLIDPKTKELRYIGYTNNIKERLNGHCRDSKLKINNHKNNWIKLLKLSGLRPEIIILEEYLTQEDALLAEINLIEYYKYIGCNLTNKTKGGDLGVNYVRTNEIKQKISKSATGRKHTEETKKKISKTLTGIKRKPFSEEHKQKLSLALKGIPTGRSVSDEQKENLRKLNSGKKSSEEAKQKSVDNNSGYKLNREKILEIKKLYLTGDYTQQELSEIFNVSCSHICRIINDKTGKYLK